MILGDLAIGTRITAAATARKTVHHLILKRFPAIEILLGDARNCRYRVNADDTFDLPSNVLLLRHEQLQALLEIVGDKAWHGAAVGANQLRQEILAHDGFAMLFLLADDLKQYRSGNVIAALLVDDKKIDLADYQVFDIRQRDVAAFFRVVKAAVRILLNYARCTHQ